MRGEHSFITWVRVLEGSPHSKPTLTPQTHYPPKIDMTREITL